MKRTPAAVVLLAAALAVGPNRAADPPTAPTPTTATKGTLPRDFKKLGLTEAQKIAVDKITGEARAKIADLEGQIAAIRDQEHKDALAVLTDAQRTQLKAILTAGVEDKNTTPPTEPKKP